MTAGKQRSGGQAPRIEFTLDTAQILLVVTALAGLCWASFLVGKWLERDRWREATAKTETRTGKLAEMDGSGDLTFFDTLGSKSAEPDRQAVPARLAPAAPPPEATRSDPTDVPTQRHPVPPTSTPTALHPGLPDAGAPNGYALQVFAGDRVQAEKIVAGLARKGYSARLMAGTSGPRSARVRVFGYRTRPDADRGAERLKREEQLRPWVVKPD